MLVKYLTPVKESPRAPEYNMRAERHRTSFRLKHSNALASQLEKFAEGRARPIVNQSVHNYADSTCWEIESDSYASVRIKSFHSCGALILGEVGAANKKHLLNRSRCEFPGSQTISK